MSKFVIWILRFLASGFIQAYVSRSSSEWVLPRAVKQSLSNTSRKSMESEVYNIGLLLLLLLLLLQSYDISTTALVGLVTTRQSLQQSCSCFQHTLFTHTHTHTLSLSLSLSLVAWDLNVSFFLSSLSLFSLLSFLPSGLMVFGLVLKPEISSRVTIAWRVLVSYRGFFEDYIFAWGNIWVSTIHLLLQATFECKWQGHSVTQPLFF